MAIEFSGLPTGTPVTGDFFCFTDRSDTGGSPNGTSKKYLWVDLAVKQVFEFTAASMQTVFTPLPTSTTSPTLVTAFRNGQQLEEGVDFTVSGNTLTYLGTVLAAGERISGFYNDQAGAAINSVFGRTGTIVAVSGDYAASQVTNDSSVAGADVAAALDTLDGQFPANLTQYFLPDVGGDSGNHRVRTLSTNGSFNFEFAVPNDFGTLVSLEMIITPSAGAAGAGKDVDLSSSYGNPGELANFHSETDNTTTYNFGVAATFAAIDISSVFSVLSANDICGLNWDNNAVGGSIDIYCIKLVYTR